MPENSHDPAETGDDQHTKYRFFSTVRRGFRPGTTFEKSDLDDNALGGAGKTTIQHTAAVTGGPDKGTEESGTVDLSMYGPGHVTGIDGGQVVRMEPEPDSSTTPPNYFPFVEFETPDLLWLFSPVKEKEQGRNFPWLTLVVVEKEAASLDRSAEGPNPVLEAPENELPRIEDSWAWAHAQVTGDPSRDHKGDADALASTFRSRSDKTVSRLLCPRDLDASTTYVAAVVPTFEAGRKVGLGEAPPEQGENPTMDLAWPNSKNASDGTVRLPVYHHWEFSTSKKGDFEYLVRRLESRDLSSDEYSIGYREIDVTDPGPENLDFDDGAVHTVRLPGALQAAECDDWWWYEQSDELRRLLNTPTTALASNTGGYDVVGPPIYGQWHSQEVFEDRANQGDGFLDLSTGDSFDWADLGSDRPMSWCGGVDDATTDGGTSVTSVERHFGGYGPVKPKLAPSTGPDSVPYGEYGEQDLQWLYDLNLTPGFRIPASVGAGIVQDQQENLMTSAWEQVGDVREANRRLSAAQLSRGATTKAVERLTAAGFSTERLLQVTEPAHDRLYLEDKGTTAAEHFAASSLPSGVLAPAFRRLTRPSGRLAHRLETDASGQGVVSKLLDPEFDQSLDDSPDGMVTAGDEDRGPGGLCRDARELAAPEERREQSPEDRDDDGAENQPSRDPPADAAYQQLLSLRGDAESVLGMLKQVRGILTTREPTEEWVKTARMRATDAVGAWDSLDTSVQSFGSIITRVAAKSDQLPTVANTFTGSVKDELYGDMTRPFDEPFLPSVDSSADAGSDEGDGNGPSFPVTVEEVRAAEDLAEAVLRALDDVLAYFGAGGSDAAYLERLFCGRPTRESDPVEPDPAAVETAWSPVDSFVDRTIERLGAPALRRRPDPLDTVMAYPEFPQPMYRDLKDVSEEYVLPGAEEVPQNSMGALMTNRRFIEAFMAGLNHEMASELLWRNYPTDRKGSYFKRFWDQRSRIPKPDNDDKLDDVIPLHRWDDKGADNRGPSPLGSNVRTGETDDDKPPDERTFDSDGADPDSESEDPDSISPTVVFLVRGELLQRYPNTTVYAAKATADGEDRVPTWASPQTKATEEDTEDVKFPIFRGKLDPDITFLGFDLTTEEALYAPYHEDDTADPADHANEGWFFVLSEPPGETRFGLDVGQEGETKRPFGVSKRQDGSPRKATKDQVEEGAEHGWSGLSWEHLENGDDVPYVDVENSKPGTENWIVKAGDKWAEGDKEDFVLGPEEAATWKKNSAHMAYITWQQPVRTAIHADDVLPEDNR